MKYLSAYALAWLSGKEPTVADVEKILASVGAEIDVDRVKQVVDTLHGKQLQQLVAQGFSRLQSVGGGASASAGAPAAAQEQGKAAEPEKPAPADEKVEDALEGGMDLFGGDEW
jgi:large subunit ribosomal protein LP2